MRGTLLHQHLAFGIEEENAESAMQSHIARLLIHSVAVGLGGCSNGSIVVVHQDALLLEGVRLQRIVHGIGGHLALLLLAHGCRRAASQPGETWREEIPA